MNIVIVGGGLSGLTAARVLSEHSGIHVTLIDRGQDYSTRSRESSPDLISGLGGAGTVFGGKLCMPPASSAIWRKTNSQLHAFPQMLKLIFDPHATTSAATEISLLSSGIWEKKYTSFYISKSNMSRRILVLLETLQKQAVDIRTECEFLGFHEVNGTKVVTVNERGQTLNLFADALIIATGRSSSGHIPSWFTEGDIVTQCPDLGIRMSLDLASNPAFAKQGADLKLKANYKNMHIRTFCVCSGGEETLVSWDGTQYYDGHFGDLMTSIVNLGILARSPDIQGTKAAWNYCQDMRRHLHKPLSLQDFLNCGHLLSENPMHNQILGAIRIFVHNLYSAGVIKQPSHSIPVYLPSVDNLNPTIKTDSYFQTSKSGVYVIGDAAGISRGFVQSAWSGHCAASAILSASAVPERSPAVL